MKKVLKSVISIIFCLTLIFTSMLPAFAAVAKVKTLTTSQVTATTATLKWSKVSGATGYEVEQYVSKNWKKIATSTKTTYTVKKLKLGSSYKFRVRALQKSGKTVSYGGYSKTLTVKPAPAKVTGLKVSSSASTTATIKWTKVSGATAYRVQQYVNKKWVTVVKSTKKNSAKITTLAPGATNQLRVCAIQKVKSKTYYGAYSAALKVKTSKLVAPKNPTASSITETSATISWKAVTGATKYIIYSIVGDTQKVVAKTTKTKYTVTDLKTSTNYIFSVRALANVNSKNYYSSFSDNLSVKTSPAKASKPTAKPSDTEVSLSWKKTSGADGYEIYQYNTQKKTWDYIGSSTTNSYNVIRLSSLASYQFKIRAYHTATSKKVYGEFSDPVTVTTLAGKVSNLAVSSVTDSSIAISWTAVSKADSYKVEMSTDGKKWTAVSNKPTSSSGKVSVTVTSLKASTDYIFRVSVVVSGNPGVTTEISIRTAPSKVTGLIANDLRKTVDPLTGKAAKKINLTWNSVTGAMGYEISRYDSANGWKSIGASEGTSFSVTDVNDDIEYSFRIRAYYTSNKVNYYGPYSDIVLAKELPAQITGLAVGQVGTGSATITWDIHSKAEKYAVRLKEGNGTYQEVKVSTTVQNGKVSATLGSLKAGLTYSVSVCAVIGSDESYPISVTFKTVPGKTERLVVTDSSDTSITLAWDAVAGADGYEIEKLDSNTNQYIKIESVSTISLIAGGLTPSSKYSFRVRAYNESNGKTQYGAYSDIVSATTVAASVSLISVSSVTANSAVLSWTAQSGAAYKVEMSKNGGSYVSAGTPTVSGGKATLKATSLEAATTYSFRVCTVNGTAQSAWTTVSFKTAPTAPKNFVASATSENIISTSWSAVSGADGYEVSIKKNGGSWSVLGTTKNDYYEVTGLTASTAYTLRVRAYTSLNSVVSYSGYTNEVTETTRSNSVAVTGFTATAKSDSSIELSWNAIAGASYKIEKSENGSVYSNVTNSPVTSGNKTTVLVTGLSSGTRYYFRIYATVSGETTVSSVVSATTTGRSSVAEVKNISATSSASGTNVSIKVTWTAYSGASYYLVRCDNPAMSFRTTSSSYTIASGITGGKTYTLYVEAYSNSGILIARSAEKSCKAATASSSPSSKPIKNIKLETNNNGKSYMISWDSVDNAVYSVERWNAATSSWENIPNYKYTPRVSVEIENKSMKVNYTKKSDYVSSISWQSVSGATTYSVQSEYSNGSEEWKREMTTTSTSVDLRLAPQSKQTIRVSAISNIKFRIHALNASDEAIELASSEYTSQTYTSYGDVSFTTPSVANTSSVDSKEAYTLMLVQAINNTKLEKTKVSMNAVKNLNADLDKISVTNILGIEVPLDRLLQLFPDAKKELDSFSDEMSENSVTKCDFEYGYGRASITQTDLDGKSQTATRTLYLSTFLEPADSFAYLYDQHNINSFSKGVDSVVVTPTSNGGYRISVGLKTENATSQKDANYHMGFAENFAVNSASLAEFGSDSKGSVSGTKITATVNRDYKLDSINISGKFFVSISISEGGYKISTDIVGKVDSNYTFTR